MKIAFDAKRAFQNNTGLGHYSRTLISSLATTFPEHQYYLCAPKVTNKFLFAAYTNMQLITPKTMVTKQLRSLWRSKWVTEDLEAANIDLYHGLSHEIPLSIRSTKIKTVVTIHDLIFERYPDMYNWIDVQIYRNKFKYACTYSDKIIAISKQTRDDLVQFYKVPPEKIEVCYQGCNPAFSQQVPVAEKQRLKLKYNLPDQFFLSVGSIIERKNLLNIVKALQHTSSNVPLVVIGEGGPYKKEVQEYISKNGLSNRVIFLSENPEARFSSTFQSAAEFPALYQLSSGLIYPSIFEGFGIPVLEGLAAGIPVITSNISCLPETGGDAAFYVDPYKPAEIASAMDLVLTNAAKVADMRAKGLVHVQQFTPEKCADAVMQVYLRL